MILQKINYFIKSNYYNSKNWKSSKKIIVIESDDWGNNRIPNIDTKKKLEYKWGKFPERAFENYDSLLTSADFSALFKVLNNHKGSNGKPPIITANTIMANPNFAKIRDSNFEEYYYESFTETLNNSPQHIGVFDSWEKGVEKGFFYPQLHGREHINVPRWLTLLREGNKHVLQAFDYNIFGLGSYLMPNVQNSILAAFDYDNVKDLKFGKKSIMEASTMFEQLFGYKSETFIAPNYVWGDEVLETLKQCGVKGIQGLQSQIMPKFQVGNKNKFHYLGEMNTYGQRYLIRNVFFEPFEFNEKKLLVKNCLQQVADAFKRNTAATISTHRVNFSGNISLKNRNENLEAFDELISQIIKQWPDVEFVTSPQLLNKIN